jgi:hypothetical protein
VRSAAFGLLTTLIAASPQIHGAERPVAKAVVPSISKPAPLLRASVPSGPPPPIMKLSEVRPGMVGHALTVFQGTKPEPFKIKVISVLRNFLPKEDVILVRAEDPRVAFSGIVAGMSGSPVYIDGKLVGAIAFAWSFSKEPLGGVTPIETMLAERARPRRSGEEVLVHGGTWPNLGTTPGKAPGPAPAPTPTPTPAPTPATTSRGGAPAKSGRIPTPTPTPAPTPATTSRGGAPAKSGPRASAEFDPTASWARQLGLPPVAGSGSAGEPRLVRASVPLAISGFSPRTIAELADELRGSGLMPMQAGGGRKPGPPAAGHVEPGSAIGVELVRGDMSMVATGTVTYVDDSQVLAFGHPLFGIGEVYLPMVDAEIHAFLPSLSQSFKMSSPLHEVGMLVQDRQSCIIGNLDARTTMLPVDVRVLGPGAEPRLFHAEVARNRRLTPVLASLVVGNAIAHAEPDVADMIVTVSSKVGVKGFAPLELRDQMFSADGVSARSLSLSRGLRAMGELLVNPYQPVVIDRLDVDVQVQYRRDVAEIVGIAMPGVEVRAGDTVPLRVTLRPYAAPEYVEIIPVVVPRTLAGSTIKIEVATGAMVRPDVPSAETLRGYIDNLRKAYSASSIVVTLQTQDDGASLRGQLIQGLPASAMDTLRPANQTRRADAFRIADRTVFPARQLVSGKQELSVLVKDDTLGAR